MKTLIGIYVLKI